MSGQAAARMRPQPDPSQSEPREFGPNLMKIVFNLAHGPARSIFEPMETLTHRMSCALVRGIPRRFLTIAGAFLLILPAVRGGETDDIVAVYSSVSPAYARARLPGGSFKPESYAFGEGGNLGGVLKDLTIDKLTFTDVAHLIAPSLAAQNYVPCRTNDPHLTDLLIMVYWGTTTGTNSTSSSSQYQIAQGLNPPPRPPPPPAPTGLGGTAMASDPSTSGAASVAQQNAVIKAADDSAQQMSLSMTSAANRQRDHQNMENAMILGYLDEIKRVDTYKLTALSQRRQDVVDEVEESRYYVVLLAYDFRSLLVRKERKLLWETRFSIPERRNEFNKQLAAMAQSASRYFGQDSQGLLRKPLPATNVTFGELKVIGVEPEAKK